MTGYWDLRTVTSRGDARRRLRAFTGEIARSRVTLLDREELLHTLRRGAPVEVTDPKQAPYRAGLALQGDDATCAHGLGPLDLHSMARRRYGPADILIRHHSAALTRCTEGLGAI